MTMVTGVKMKELLAQLEEDIYSKSSKWECPTPHQNPAHYMKRGQRWIVHLVVIDEETYMGSATYGTIVMKLTDELALAAKQTAEAAFA